jgi:localization factor PodJL
LALPADAAPGSIAESAARTETAPEAAANDAPLSATPAPAPVEAAPAQPAPAHAAPLHPTSAPASNKAAPTLSEAAARGERSAQYQLALQRFVEARPDQAVALLKRAADQGLAMAQYRLAKAYERGEGVPASKEQARQWTEKAAMSGNAKAMHDLGVYLASAPGAALDEASAFTWFKRAAELGVSDSQFNVALMYLQGRGAAPDSQQAYYWFQVAAAAGDHDAAARAAMIERQLGASAKQVRARARTFSPRPMLAEANGVIDQSWASSEQLQASASSGPHLIAHEPAGPRRKNPRASEHQGVTAGWKQRRERLIANIEPARISPERGHHQPRAVCSKAPAADRTAARRHPGAGVKVTGYLADNVTRLRLVPKGERAHR